jgi:hypothetical protein
MGWCEKDEVMSYVMAPCSRCGGPLTPSPLLFPVTKKNYQDGGIIEAQWKTAQSALENCFMFTIFGYSAPSTDIEAMNLLKEAWARPGEYHFEQTELINKTGSDPEALYETWEPFIHSHHYKIHESYYDSWMARHPRRTGEAYYNQNILGNWIEDNPVPSDSPDLESLIGWFEPLFAAEAQTGVDPRSDQ